MASAGEEAEMASLPDQKLFELRKLFSSSNIRLSARSEVGQRQLLAFVSGSGDLSLHYLPGDVDQFPVMRHIPWFMDSEKRIMAICFDPSGTWLLIAAYDNSLHIIPALALVDSSAVLDHRWSTTDVTSFPSSASTISVHARSSHPAAIVWWQSVMDCQHSAILGNEHGDLIFISLTTGTQVGITYVKSNISTLHICQDNSLDSVFLLITDDSCCQWKLMLEQRATGYSWPIDSIVGSAKVSGLDLSSSQNSIDLEFGNRSGSQYPTARSRLRGLKQLSVEKLASLRQRLAETRSKGITSGNGSSSSSSDETGGNSSKRNSSTGMDSSYLTTGPIPDKLSAHVGETFLHPQYTKGRYLLSGYYMPSSILTIHGMSLEVVPLFVHKLPPGCRDVVVTDRFLFVTDIGRNKLSVISNQLSESRLDGDMEHNPESIIQSYTFGENEHILDIYKCTQSNYQKKEDSNTLAESASSGDVDGSGAYKGDRQSLSKDLTLAKIDCPPVDSCIIITSQGMYKVKVRCVATEVFMELVLKHQELERAERLALIFGLNLQELLEYAGDVKLAAKEFPQAIALYKLSRCRHLKSVLKFAAGGHSSELLSYINLLFSTSGLDLAPSERIHLSNLAVMSYTEQVLRSTTGKVTLFKNFLQFLRENLYYDEVLAVNVAGQTGLWEVLQFLASYRGLHQEVLDILTKIMRSHSDIKSTDGSIAKQAPALDSGLWLCVTDPSLQQSLLAKPQFAKIHVNFVSTHLAHMEPFALQRLAALYDPSSPAFHFSLRRLFKVFRQRQSSSSSSSYSGHLDSIELMDQSDELQFPMEPMIQTFLLVLLCLVKKCQPCPVYNAKLMKKVVVNKEQAEEDTGDLIPTVPLQVNHLSSGFAHVALVRNGTVYSWGNAVQGCLGTGPTMSRYNSPQPINMFPSLMLEVTSVACGRQHTLALTNNGVYAWGASQYGQLGIGRTVQSPYPSLVDGLTQERIMAVSCGQYHSAALAHDGRVFTWGWGVHGQLGHGSIEDVHHPMLIKHLVGKVVTQVCGGHGHTIVLTSNGDVFTFGSSVFGQLGNGTNIKSSLPLLVTGIPEPVTLIATGYFHNLAVSSSNKLYTWGSSPQALRLQAQAQKKARLLQQQTIMQSSRQEELLTSTTAVSSVDSGQTSLTKICSSETSNSSLNLSLGHLADHGENLGNSPSTQFSISHVSGNSPVNINKTSLGCDLTSDKLHLESSQQLSSSSTNSRLISSSTSSDVLNTSQNNCLASVDSQMANSSEFRNPAVMKSTSLTLDKDILTGGGSSTKCEQLLKEENSVLLPCNVSNLPSILIDDEDLSKGISGDSNLQVDDLDLKSAYTPTLPAIVLGKPGRQQPIRWEGDDSQAHLFPQLVDTGLVSGPIAQISCGCHHSALLTKDGVLYMWGRNLDGQVGNGSRKEVSIPTPLSSTPTVSMKSPTGLSGVIPSAGFERLKLQQVCCGCEFTAVLEVAGGKVWAWGNNSQAQLGIPPLEDSKPLEGKLVMLKTSKRVIKLPHGMHNSSDVPREIPSVPVSSISFRPVGCDGQGQFINERWREGGPSSLCPPLCSVEETCYGSQTLHFALQHFHGHYDSKHLLSKCLELENFQAAAKLSALDRNYHLALAYQLKALDMANEESSSEKQDNLEDVANSQDGKVLNKSAIMTETKKGGGKNLEKEITNKIEKLKIESQNKNKNQKNRAKLPISTSENDLANKENVNHSVEKATKRGVVNGKDVRSKLVSKSFESCDDVPSEKLDNGKNIVGAPENVEESLNVKKRVIEETRSLSLNSTSDNVASVNNPDESEMHTFAIQGGLEQMFEDKPFLMSPDSSSPIVCDGRTPLQSLNSDSLGASEHSAPTNKEDSVSEQDIIVEVSKFSKEDSGVSLMSEDHSKFCDNNSLGNTDDRRLPESSNVIAIATDSKLNLTTKHKDSVKIDNTQSEDGLNESTEHKAKARHRELVAEASAVVDYYVSVMEEESHTMMSQLLQQGFDFWLSHSLPVEHLEILLLKHMAKFFYPLGLMLFCDRKDDVGSGNNLGGQQHLNMLNHLSAHFCLQLCSVLLGHIQQKKTYPDYIDVLAQITSTQLGPVRGVNGCYPGVLQTPEQLMETILCGLGGLKNPGDPSDQSYVTLNQEGINLCNEESGRPDQLMVFSCGHRYGSQTFHQTVIPEMELGLLQLHRPLPHTARALKSLFDTSVPSLQLACPKCLLNHLQTQAM